MSIVDAAKDFHLAQSLFWRAGKPICLFVGLIGQGCNRKGLTIYFV